MNIKNNKSEKFGEPTAGEFLDSEKELEGKFRSLGWIFAVLFGLPMLFLVLGLVWKGIKWLMSVLA